MDTNDSSIPYSHYEEGAPVGLKETYVKQNGGEHLKEVLDERICRKCKQIVTSELTSEEVNVDTLSRFALEVNGSSKGHVICKACIDSQDTRTYSLNNSLNVKEEIDDVFDDMAIEGLSGIKVKYMEIKSEAHSRGTPFPNLKEEPPNCSNDCTSEYIETTHIKCEDIEIKSEEDYSEMELGRQGHKNDLEKQTYNCNLSDYITDQKGPTTPSTRESKVKTTDKIPVLKQENLETHTYECDSCGYKASRIDNFRRHRLRHEDVSEKMYRCNECDYMTDKRRYLSQHQQRHRKIPEKPMLKCESCDYKTSQKNHLRRHQLRHKSVLEKQMYRCNFCDYVTDQTESLKRHVRRHKKIPEGQMNPCDLCAYGAKRKDLKQHQCRHKHPPTGHKQREQPHKNIPKEKIYKCNSCEYKANVKDYLKRHLQRHRNIPEEQMFKCDLCDYKARRKDHLARHQLKHKSVSEKQMYPCNFCEYTTDKKENLSRHLRRYQEILQEQMYDCLTCGFNAHNKKNTCKSHTNT